VLLTLPMSNCGRIVPPPSVVKQGTPLLLDGVNEKWLISKVGNLTVIKKSA